MIKSQTGTYTKNVEIVSMSDEMPMKLHCVAKFR